MHKTLHWILWKMFDNVREGSRGFERCSRDVRKCSRNVQECSRRFGNVREGSSIPHHSSCPRTPILYLLVYPRRLSLTLSRASVFMGITTEFAGLRWNSWNYDGIRGITTKIATFTAGLLSPDYFITKPLPLFPLCSYHVWFFAIL